jgi:hypothetical protein
MRLDSLRARRVDTAAWAEVLYGMSTFVLGTHLATEYSPPRARGFLHLYLYGVDAAIPNRHFDATLDQGVRLSQWPNWKLIAIGLGFNHVY